MSNYLHLTNYPYYPTCCNAATVLTDSTWRALFRFRTVNNDRSSERKLRTILYKTFW